MNANGTGQVGGLRVQRRARGLSQEQLARIAGCSTGYVRLLERGFAPEHSDVLPRIFAALNDDDRAGNAVVVKERGAGAHARE